MPACIYVKSLTTDSRDRTRHSMDIGSNYSNKIRRRADRRRSLFHRPGQPSPGQPSQEVRNLALAERCEGCEPRMASKDPSIFARAATNTWHECERPRNVAGDSGDGHEWGGVHIPATWRLHVSSTVGAGKTKEA